MGKMKDLVCHDNPPTYDENLCERCGSWDESIEGEFVLCAACEEDDEKES